MDIYGSPGSNTAPDLIRIDSANETSLNIPNPQAFSSNPSPFSSALEILKNTEADSNQ